MHLILLRACGEDAQVGFQGSCPCQDSSRYTIERVAQWSQDRWRTGGWFLCNKASRRKVTCGVLPPSQGGTHECSYVSMSSALCLADVGEWLDIEALKRGPSAAYLIFVVISSFPCYNMMSESIVQTIARLEKGELKDSCGSMTKLLYAGWCATVRQNGCLTHVLQAADRPQQLDGLAALDGSSSTLTSPGAQTLLEMLQRFFSRYRELRLLQSIVMLTQDIIFVVGNDLDSVTAVTVAIPSLVAPMTPQCDVYSYVTAEQVLDLIREARGKKSLILGVTVDTIPQLVLLSLTQRKDAPSWWFADTRSGVVARAATLHVPTSLILVPSTERIKDAYNRRGPTGEVCHALLETAAATFGAYRKHLHAKGSTKEIHLPRLLMQTVGSDSSSYQPQAIALGNALATSAVWNDFFRTIVEVESSTVLRQALVAAMRVGCHSTETPAISMNHANVINFMIRSSKRYPECFVEELAVSGKSIPRDGAAGRLFKGLLGKAKDVVSQISSAGNDVEYSRYEQPYCQCYDSFWSPPSEHYSVHSARHNCTECAEIKLPADIVHNFAGYHLLLSPRATHTSPAPNSTHTSPSTAPTTITPNTTPSTRDEASTGPSVKASDGAAASDSLPLPLTPPPVDRQDVLDSLFPSFVSAPAPPSSQQGTNTTDIDSFFR